MEEDQEKPHDPSDHFGGIEKQRTFVGNEVGFEVNMEEIIEATRQLNRMLKESNEYKRFVRAHNALHANEELYMKLKQLKDRYKEVQTYWEGNPFDEIYRLCAEHDWLLHNSLINEYLRAESAFSRLVRRMLDEVTADFPIDFD